MRRAFKKSTKRNQILTSPRTTNKKVSKLTSTNKKKILVFGLQLSDLTFAHVNYDSFYLFLLFVAELITETNNCIYFYLLLCIWNARTDELMVSSFGSAQLKSKEMLTQQIMNNTTEREINRWIDWYRVQQENRFVIISSWIWMRSIITDFYCLYNAQPNVSFTELIKSTNRIDKWMCVHES